MDVLYRVIFDTVYESYSRYSLYYHKLLITCIKHKETSQTSLAIHELTREI